MPKQHALLSFAYCYSPFYTQKPPAQQDKRFAKEDSI